MPKYFRKTVILLMTCAGIFYSNRSDAQKFFLFAHGLYANPVDNYFKHNYNYGLGAEAGVGIGIGNTFFVGTVGYTSFSHNSSNNYGQLSYVPVKIGLRHYLFPGNILFLHADAGIGIVKNELFNGSSFTGDLGLGVKLGALEITTVYDGFSRTIGGTSGYSSWIGVKAGVQFGL
ncbi:MAG TPA: hypothetical protein VK543_12355 [Puia sp.]|nr:hypothetical protein [Puia sp.]